MLTIGIDLAQSRDRTALIALDSFRPQIEPTIEELNAMNPVRDVLRGRRRAPRSQVHHEVIHIERFPAGITYPEQVSRLIRTVDALSVEESASLLVDATGVGKPVVEMIRESCHYPLRAVTITGGSEVVKSGRDVSVPKADLVGCLEVTLSTHRLHATPDLPHSEELDRELRAFGYELSATGKPKYEGKGSHDDLVLALCLALWGAERGGSIGANFTEFMRRDTARRRGYFDEVFG
jgi:hypothetical protein